MKKLSYIKSLLPFDVDYLSYLMYLSPTIKYNEKNYVKILVSFVTSIYFANLIINFFPDLLIDVSKAVNFFSLIKMLILNLLLFSSVYCSVVYFLTKDLSKLHIYFLQIIKMYSVLHLTICILLTINIHIMANQYVGSEITFYNLLFILIIIFNFYIVHKYMGLTIYKLVETRYKFITTTILVLTIIIIPNVIFHNFSYFKAQTFEVINKHNLCQQYADLKFKVIEQNKDSLESEINMFAKKCENKFDLQKKKSGK